jgi:hypothetical protein
MCRSYWMQRVVQKWLKPFTGAAPKPLHRLRGLFADQVATLTQEAMLIQFEAIKAASKALGHTGTAVTMAHYLSGPFSDRARRMG